jgi:hypothetical protein
MILNKSKYKIYSININKYMDNILNTFVSELNNYFDSFKGNIKINIQSIIDYFIKNREHINSVENESLYSIIDKLILSNETILINNLLLNDLVITNDIFDSILYTKNIYLIETSFNILCKNRYINNISDNIFIIDKIIETLNSLSHLNLNINRYIILFILCRFKDKTIQEIEKHLIYCINYMKIKDMEIIIDNEIIKKIVRIKVKYFLLFYIK